MRFPLLSTITFVLLLSSATIGLAQSDMIYELRTYQTGDLRQDSIIDSYLKHSLIPALKRQGVKEIGVFKPVNNDTLQNKRTIMFIPYKSMKQLLRSNDRLKQNKEYLKNSKEYLESTFNNPPFKRIETVLLSPFSGMPKYSKPSLNNMTAKRVYELRSYEGPTEQLFARKVEMFNEGGEIKLFDRLGFNAVFYGSVIAGARMPNLMYMTSFEDIDSRNAQWKKFSADEEWKKLSAMEYYKHTVSKNEIVLLHPTSYSDL